MNGRLDDKWDAAGAARLTLTEFWTRPDATPTGETTTVRIACDDHSLYIGFHCIDTRIVGVRTAPDDQTYRDDSVEVFFADDRERLSDAIGLEVSVTGAIADFYYRHSDWFHYGWDSHAIVKTGRVTFPDGRPGFVIEMAIPRKTVLPALGLLQSGDLSRLRANFGRWNQRPGEEPSSVFSLWSHSGLTFPSPHRPERYGRLILADSPDPAEPEPGGPPKHISVCTSASLPEYFE
ncbi:MAG: carbohydrate-binding family 9-like protein [Opitutaceae bacterium]|nr:carbohydrate-binding family 9-like protein [Opitutaceae bacterium]